MTRRTRKIIKGSALLLLVLGVILVAIVLLNPFGKLKHLIFDAPTESIEIESSSVLSVPSSPPKEEEGEKQNTNSSEDEYANYLFPSDSYDGIDKEMYLCHKCDGTGYLDCSTCYATGITNDGALCLVCYGDGKIPCEH